MRLRYIGDQLSEMLLRHRNSSRRQAQDRAVYLLEQVGISGAANRLNQYPHQLSGGLRQRVMIAMMLMCEPALIIADEPTTALDVTVQAQILLVLAQLQKELDMGLILITHDLGVVSRIADRVAVMYGGEIVESGSAGDIFDNPTHPYTQGLLNCMPIPGKTERGGRLGVVPGHIASLVGDMTGCSFHDRCAYASDVCKEPGIDLKPLRGAAEKSVTHVFRCILSADESARNYQAERP